MTLVIGIDPGAKGAIAVYCSETQRVVCVDDIPTFEQTINKRKRKRLDNIGAMELFDTYAMMGVEMAVIESVGGRPGQSAAAGFVFGYMTGAIVQMMIERKILIETTPAGTWKAIMNIPGKKKATDDDIMLRATELFPHTLNEFRTARGGKRVDRAEAAMIAKFGADHLWRLAPTMDDVEYKLAYRKADIGA